MPSSMPLAKATLQELQPGTGQPGEKKVEVQFNPETLKLSYSIQTSPSGSDSSSNTTPKQIISGNTTKLSMQLWFDVSAQSDGTQAADDVRQQTKDVIYFVTARKNDQGTLFVPEVQVSWGSFLFQGVVESLEESLEFFSNEGKPLRASISLSLSSQKLLEPTPQNAGGPGGNTPGTNPLAQALAGISLQGLAANVGLGGNWQAIAAANGIDNPLRLSPGQLVNLNASGSAGVGASASAGISGSLGVTGSASVSGSL
jgi:hypothetical protein